MTRLIDADALLYTKQLEPMGNGYYEETWIIHKDDIDNAPTIEIVQQPPKCADGVVQEHDNGMISMTKQGWETFKDTLERYKGEIEDYYIATWDEDDTDAIMAGMFRAESAPQTDLISRADAIEAVHKVTIDLLQDRCMPIGCATDFTDAIRELPSALPSAEAKEGENNERK